MGIELDVNFAIYQNAETMLSGATSLPLKMPGRIFTPPNDQKYIEVLKLSNDFERTWGAEKVFQGFVRVIVHWPNDDSGIVSPISLCETIVNLFPKGLFLAHGLAMLQVAESPVILDPIYGGQETLYPVSFAYGS